VKLVDSTSISDLRILRDVNGNAVAYPKTFTKEWRGDSREIESQFTEISQYILEDLEPYLWAVHLYRNKETDKALTKIWYCMSQKPEQPEFTLLLWGLILIDRGKYDEAIAKRLGNVMLPVFPAKLNVQTFKLRKDGFSQHGYARYRKLLGTRRA
jgi:hypothetical protein